MSKTLDILKTEKIGFRTESFSGSGVRNAMDVVRFEITELLNEDIMLTMQKLYGLDFYEFLNLGEELLEISDFLINKIFTFLENKMEIPKEDMKAIWLTTEEMVKKRYCFNNESVINKYEIGESWIPISDLDKDGILFIYCDYQY